MLTVCVVLHQIPFNSQFIGCLYTQCIYLCIIYTIYIQTYIICNIMHVASRFFSELLLSDILLKQQIFTVCHYHQYNFNCRDMLKLILVPLIFYANQYLIFYLNEKLVGFLLFKTSYSTFSFCRTNI